MNFKKKLEEHFKQFEASPVLFVGSGVSRRYLGVPCWQDLLKHFAEAIGENHIKLKTKSNGDLPEYAQLLVSAYAEKWWDTKEGQLALSEKEQEKIFINEQSPLKLSISKYIENAHKNIIENDELKHEISLFAKANIDGVITTNWDVFLESLFPKEGANKSPNAKKRLCK
ncbi:hypothetical protein [Morganella morganii]|jgi:hypothetical protein|uniref:hypothetical protein n=1 Tax=Morganella morganii TaxID=582 RepID=UPI003EB75BF2